MFNAYLGTRRRLVALPGLLVTVALTAVPTAFAVPIMPDGGSGPRVDDAPGQAPVVHTAKSGLDWAQVSLVVAIVLVVIAITAAALALTHRRRLGLAAR
jgi:hypothetical protein